MSIGNIGGEDKDPFIPPEESEKEDVKDQEKQGLFSGHAIDVPNVEDKESKLASSLPDLSKKIQESSWARTQSDSNLEREHIYDVPKSFFQKEAIYDVPKGVGIKEGIYDVPKGVGIKEGIYDVPKGVGIKEGIYDVPKSLKERSGSTLQSMESKVKTAAGFLSSTQGLDQEAIYDVPTKAGASGFVREEEPIYEDIDVLLTQLGLLSDFDYDQQQEVNGFIESVVRSADDCMHTCETLLKDSTQTSKEESIKSKFSKVVSNIEKVCEKITEQLNKLKIDFIKGWKKQFSKKASSPTSIYYKQTTSRLTREKFMVPSVSLSSEAKQKLQDIAKQQNLEVQFLVSGDQTLIIMTTPEIQTPFQKVQEKVGSLLASIRSLYQTKVTSQTQSANLDLVSEALISLLKLLTNFSQRVTDLARQQQHFLEGMLSQSARRRSYSLESEKSSLESQERYRKTDTEEEDTKL